MCEKIDISSIQNFLHTNVRDFHESEIEISILESHLSFAFITIDDLHNRISISRALIGKIEQVHLKAVHSSRSDISNMGDEESIGLRLRMALLWVVLHELQHRELGHFEVMSGTPKFGLRPSTHRVSNRLNMLPQAFWLKVEPCLELQADNDATEWMLDCYSREGWVGLRAKIASISAVMVLIEKADEENAIEHSTHPKAATRIFQLLGHVTDMWTLPAVLKARELGLDQIDPDDLPPDDEVLAFSKEVIMPAYQDAVALAEAAEAKSIIADMGKLEDFITDIGRAKLGQWDELVTVGAKEWAELKDANDLILPLLPINQGTN